MQFPTAVGRTIWAIPDGYIPNASTGAGPALISHDAACMLNVSARDAHVELMVYFTDRAPAGPYAITVPAFRTRHVRFNDLSDPEPIPRGTDYSSLIISDQPIVVQHTRLDSRQPALALMSAIPFSYA